MRWNNSPWTKSYHALIQYYCKQSKYNLLSLHADTYVRVPRIRKSRNLALNGLLNGSNAMSEE